MGYIGYRANVLPIADCLAPLAYVLLPIAYSP
jgi:hypothetical protein